MDPRDLHNGDHLVECVLLSLHNNNMEATTISVAHIQTITKIRVTTNIHLLNMAVTNSNSMFLLGTVMVLVGTIDLLLQCKVLQLMIIMEEVAKLIPHHRLLIMVRVLQWDLLIQITTTVKITGSREDMGSLMAHPLLPMEDMGSLMLLLLMVEVMALRNNNSQVVMEVSLAVDIRRTSMVRRHLLLAMAVSLHKGSPTMVVRVEGHP